MNSNRYLRAYMAGITPPTAIFLVLFALAFFVLHAPPLMQRGLLFPLAVIPNAFGLWNVLFIKLHSNWNHPIGLHGAALPFLIAPLGFVFATSMGILRTTDGALIYFELIRIPFAYLIFAPFIAIAAYYLIWKYVVGYLNAAVGLPG